MCALIERELKKASPAQCVHLLYVISAICRASAKKHGGKDKYGQSACLGSSANAVPLPDSGLESCKLVACSMCSAISHAAGNFMLHYDA